MIQISELTKYFDRKSIAALDKVSFAIQKNEILALIGHSGAGKSTLANLLMKKIQADSGTISSTPKDLKVVLMEQEGHQFSNSEIYPSIIDSADCEDEKQADLLARDLIEYFHLEAHAKKSADELSGGQRQRVQLAKAIIKQPHLLILDEPFSHLDPNLRIELMRELKERASKDGFSILIITHDLQSALAYSDRVALLDQGRLLQIGTSQELYQKPASSHVAEYLGPVAKLSFKISTQLTSEFAKVDIPTHYQPTQHFVLALIRPEHIAIGAKGFKGKVSQILFQGHQNLIVIEVKSKFTFYAYSTAQFQIGQKVEFFIDWNSVIFSEEL